MLTPTPLACLFARSHRETSLKLKPTEAESGHPITCAFANTLSFTSFHTRFKVQMDPTPFAGKWSLQLSFPGRN